MIDNHSADNSIELFEKRFPNLSVIKNSDNFGYAGGNNVGIKEALERGAEYVLILNNDTTVEPGFLIKLIKAMEQNPRAGMAAPKVLYYDDREVINSLGTAIDWLRLRPFLGYCNQKNNGQFPGIMKKDILVGCALLVSKKTIKQIGAIDENFFIFHEEADWCFRSLKSGFENIVVPDAVIYHKASKTMRKFSELTHYYSSRNFLYMAHRNASFPNLVKVYVGLCYLILKHAGLALSGDPANRKMAKAFFLGIWDFFAGNMGKCLRTF